MFRQPNLVTAEKSNYFRKKLYQISKLPFLALLMITDGIKMWNAAYVLYCFSKKDVFNNVRVVVKLVSFHFSYYGIFEQALYQNQWLTTDMNHNYVWRIHYVKKRVSDYLSVLIILL